jgi:hypothetical protein
MTGGDPLILCVEYLPKYTQRYRNCNLDRFIHGNETLNFDERNARPQIHAHSPQYLDGLVPSQTVAYNSCLYLRREGRGFWVGNLDLVPGPIFVLLLSQSNLALRFLKIHVLVKPWFSK